MKDFFISYNRADKTWAEWIAWQLEAAGYSTVVQAWDFRPGGNFVLEMQRAMMEAERTVAVQSPNHLEALYTQPEWAGAFAGDPTGAARRLVPVRVRECELKGLLATIIYIDLLALDEAAAREALLQGVAPGERIKPDTSLAFPGPSSQAPVFPASPAQTRSAAAINPATPSPTGNQTISIGGNVTGSILNQGEIKLR